MAVQGFNTRNGNDQAPREEKAVSTLRSATAVQNRLGSDLRPYPPKEWSFAVARSGRVTTFATTDILL